MTVTLPETQRPRRYEHGTYAAAVAAEVRAQLARLGITQTQVARATGLSQVSVSRRVRGEVAFDVVELAAVAQLAGCSITDLLPVDSNGPGDPLTELRARQGLPRLDSNQQPSGYRFRGRPALLRLAA